MEVAAMAEVILQKVDTSIILLEEPWPIRDELASLREEIEFIQAILLDDPAREDDVQQWREWLTGIKRTLYAADDLVEEISMAAKKARHRSRIRSRMRSRSRRRRHIVCLGNNRPLLWWTCLSLSPSSLILPTRKIVVSIFNTCFSIRHMDFSFNFKCNSISTMLHEVVATKGRFRDLTLKDAAASFQVTFNPKKEEEESNVRTTEANSYVDVDVDASEVIIDIHDKDEIVRMLLVSDWDVRGGDKIQVIPIVGMAGLGKTKLAQLIFNECHVANHFEQRIWVPIGDDSDLRGIIRKIVEAITKVRQVIGLEQLQIRLREAILCKRYLLVLDDVRSCDRERGLHLRNLLSVGPPGSAVIVTTRSLKVATAMGTVPPFKVEALSDHAAWSLLTRLAFPQGTDALDPQLIALCKELLLKIENVPSLISHLASRLSNQSNLNPAQLDNFMDDSQLKQYIIPLMRPSYDHLPSAVKFCFAYCALFPRDYPVDKKQLIHLWIAQGFIQQPGDDARQTLEDAGEECFMELLSWSFFKDVTADGQGNIGNFKMDVLAFYLAHSVAKSETMVVNANTVGDGIYHVFFDVGSNSILESSISLLPTHLRSFLIKPKSTMHLTRSCCAKMFSRLRCLRVLDLRSLDMTEVPSSLGSLKYLRYLNMSDNPFRALPDSITKLVNLQVLDVSHCKMLKQLPSRLSRLFSLRHLYLEGCEKLTGMPVGLGKMTSLQTLTHFVLGKGKNSCKLDELDGLNLRAELTIVFAKT